jgi:hypothetical protein
VHTCACGRTGGGVRARRQNIAAAVVGITLTQPSSDLHPGYGGGYSDLLIARLPMWLLQFNLIPHADVRLEQAANQEGDKTVNYNFTNFYVIFFNVNTDGRGCLFYFFVFRANRFALIETHAHSIYIFLRSSVQDLLTYVHLPKSPPSG